MKSTTKIFSSVITGVAMVGLIAAPAFAWHPKGVITKYVQNQTSGSQMADANDTASAVSAKPGDLLKYTIVVENIGATDSKGYNDMAKTVMTDTLPVGVELASDASKRTITENLGLIKPGQKVTKEYVVKVTSTQNGDVIKNEACFTGDSTANDNPQSGCNPAVIKVTVPTPPTTPVPPVTPPEVKAAATVLPNTGAGNLLVPAGIATGLGYAANLLRLKRRATKR
jgi:uncharacterized repeat protein (TIGR01451 family)